MARATEPIAITTSIDTTQPESTVHSLPIFFIAENGKTTIGLRICADSPNFQFRSESVNNWRSELFHRAGSSGGCTPNASGWWRVVINAQANTGEVFRIYATANDGILSEEAFMQRAARTDCRITGIGVGSCSPAQPAAVSVPVGDINEPLENQVVFGQINLRGWAGDLGSINGTSGVDAIEVRLNNSLINAVSTGQPRQDVQDAYGDMRFRNTGFLASINIRALPVGAATLHIRYHSTISNSWHNIQRRIYISLAAPSPPPTPPPPPPPSPNPPWNVPFFWQADPAWKNNRIGACNNTIGNVGCALTSVAMVFQFYGADKNPGTLNSCLGDHACGMNWGSFKILPCSNNKVRFVQRINSFSYARLEQELRQGPVIVELSNANSTHFIVVLGGSGTNPANYMVNDPGIKNGVRTTLSRTLAWFRGSPSGMRIYRRNGSLNAEPVIEPAAPAPATIQASQTEVITGSITLFSNTETEMFLELAASSNAGSIAEMQLWTNQQASDVWQPFSQYVSMPIADTYYARFRDSSNNVSGIIQVSLPSAPDTIDEKLVYLPLVIHQQ
ncbi:MAG: C39 family peptidase [Chloroflexi bacterium]|nr:C39 family peptidase [Chloroflexota bacterium]